MRNTILSALLIGALATPALADGYPVSGRWGQSTSSATGAMDYRNKSVSPLGPSNYRIVDQFTTGQVRNGSANYTLRLVDADHIEMNMSPGGMLKLQRCE